MGNNLQTNSIKNTLAKKQTFSMYLNQDAVKHSISTAFNGDQKALARFTANISSAVSNNPELAECTPQSIIASGLMANSLNLSMNSQLGYFHIVPYENRSTGLKKAQGIIGYKGLIQLAIRSNLYKKINVVAIKEGEIQNYDALNEEITTTMIEDFEEREKAKTVGYFAMIETINGFRKTLYWAKAQMENHAKLYSPGFAADLKKGTSYTYWSKNFDDMAYKTMLRQLLTKWGLLSVELEKVFEEEDKQNAQLNNNDIFLQNEETKSNNLAISETKKEKKIQDNEADMLFDGEQATIEDLTNFSEVPFN